MQERHTNRQRYFEEQALTTRKHVIPYISKVKPITKESRILEIGCGEGGNLNPFLEMGCEVIGIDINAGQIRNAEMFMQDLHPEQQHAFICRDIYDVSTHESGQFDIIMLRDVIEHIPNQHIFMGMVEKFLKPDGVIFFGFPPWRMPFGGHQQICKSKVLSKLPWFHLLPLALYKGALKAFGESHHTINSLREIKETGIGIDKFQKLVNQNGYTFLRKTLFLFNPNYEIKFGLQPREQFALIGSLPYFRDFFTTCLYCVVSKNRSTDLL